MRFLSATFIVILMAGTASTYADTIPEPDCILYGQVCLANAPASDSDDVQVIARAEISGEPRVVGQYRMGDLASASDCDGDTDCYVLRIRLETVPSGESPSGTAVVLDPQSPAQVDIFIKEGASPEVQATTISVADRGVIRRQDLRGAPATTDINDSGQTDLADHAQLHASLRGPVTTTLAPCDNADINRDGFVDLRDFALLQNGFEAND